MRNKQEKPAVQRRKRSKSVISDGEDIIINIKKSKDYRFFGRLFEPITKTVDGIDTDYSDRSRTRRALIAMFKLRAPICVLLVVAIVLAGGYFYWSSGSSATAEMSLNYEESAYGLNPNSTRFHVYEVASQEVVEGMLYYCGIDPESVDLDEIINCISVRPTNAKAFSEDNLFITTTYRITMRKPACIKEYDVKVLLNFLCKAYKDHLYNNYTENRSILDFDIEKFSDKEYMVIADLFDLKAQQIEKYLNTRVKQSKTFTEQESDETFKSLMQKVDDIRSYDVAKYRSFIIESGCSYDKARYIRSLEYVNRTKNIDYSKDMAAYTVNNDGIRMYNEMMINVVMIPSIDESKNTYYMSRTKTGMDYMAKDADNHLLTAQETAKEISYNQEVMAKMEKGTNSSADIEKANSMIKDINQKFSDLSKQIEMVDKAYVKYKTKDYLTFKISNVSLSQRLQPTKLFVLAAAILCGIFALIWLRLKYSATGGIKK